MSHIQTFILDGSEAQINEIISRLKFISRIKVGQKVDVDYETLHPDNWNTRIYRTLCSGFFRDEGKDKTLKYVQETIDNAFCIAERYLTGSVGKCDTEKEYFYNIGRIILLNMKECEKGIMALRQTYNNYDRFLASINSLLESSLHPKIKNLEQIIADINPQGTEPLIIIDNSQSQLETIKLVQSEELTDNDMKYNTRGKKKPEK